MLLTYCSQIIQAPKEIFLFGLKGEVCLVGTSHFPRGLCAVPKWFFWGLMENLRLK